MSDFLPFSRPAMGAEELAAVKAVLDSGWITTGPKNQQLEEAFCQLTGNQHAVAVCPGHGRYAHHTDGVGHRCRR